ncbi:unnamed protein product [Phaeothamnion confervicola]
MDHTMRVRTSTYLFTLKDKLRERHGRVEDLRICHSHYAEANEMADDQQTLADYGIEGAPRGAAPVVVSLYYDFLPANRGEPLLLVWNDSSTT